LLPRYHIHASSLTQTHPPALHTLSLHDALPILITLVMILAAVVILPIEYHSLSSTDAWIFVVYVTSFPYLGEDRFQPPAPPTPRDRKSTRLNSSHVAISYAVFCLKKKSLAARLD